MLFHLAYSIPTSSHAKTKDPDHHQASMAFGKVEVHHDNF